MKLGGRPKGRGHFWTREDLEAKVFALKKQGMSTNNIARQVGVSQPTVQKIINTGK